MTAIDILLVVHPKVIQVIYVDSYVNGYKLDLKMEV